jgi:hypothetical protein
MVDTNASNLVIGGILLQFDNDDIFHSVAYFSKQHSTAKIHYEIYNQDLLEIIGAFK